MKNQSTVVKSYVCLRAFLNGLSIFLGIFFLGLMSCSTATDSTSSSPTEDKTPPTVTISTNKSLEINIPGTITFIFSEKVTSFTPDDVKFLTNEANGVDAAMGNFVTNSQKSYSLEITPETNGTLYVSIQANSFEDLSGNQNTDSFSNNFLVKEDKTPPTVTISTSKFLKKDILGTITFIFSEKVNNFTPDDIQFLTNEANGVNAAMGNFVTNSQKSYSLEITPETNGTLYVSIQANSFEDLSGNKNTNSFSSSFWIRENIPPTVIINSDTLKEGESASLSFIFSEKVTNFTPDDIQILTNEANGVNAAKGNFVSNSQKTYSLEITPETSGTLYVGIQANSFEDLSANKNDKPYSNSFTVISSNTTTHTISFKLNGGSFISSQITNLKVVTNTAIEETQLGGILSYPPTGPKPSIQAVTRDIFEWRTTNGTKYDFSTLVSSDLTLEAVWSNSCGKVETFHPANRTQLQNYVDAAVVADSTTNLNHVDTSAITDMNTLFFYKRSFNGKIDCWNTANVNNMNNMFNNARTFNQDISSWNVANVTTMRSMFTAAYFFNQDISSWNVANVTTMKSMFINAFAFNQDIGSWNVANVTTMSTMFQNAKAFNQDISSWNVANVNNMSSMFASAFAFNQDIGSWNVANVNNMWGMFSSAIAFNQDIGSWDVANVNSMYGMFYNAYAFDQDISRWSVANVTTMEKMFYNAYAFNQDISRWSVANVNSMNQMFYSATNFDQDLSKWSVSNVTTYIDIFTGSAMESKTAKHPKFLDKTPPTVNISSDTLIEGNPAYLSFIFSEKVNNFTPDDIQILTNEANGVNAEKGSFVTNSQKSYSLEITPETNGTLYVSIQANSFEDLSANQNDKHYSNSFTVLDSSTATHTISFKLNGGSFISSQITTLKVVTNTAIEETRLGGILSYPPTGPKPSIQAVTRDIFEWRNNDTKYDFSTPVSNDLTLEAVWSNSCGKVETFHPTNKNELQNYVDAAIGADSTTNLNHIDTSAITDMNKLFRNKASFNGKIGCWNTAKANNMNNMFAYAYAFNQDISSWNVANVTSMENMFNNASPFNQDIGSWNVANVTNMGGMFAEASVFNQDISSWNVGNVNNMEAMFYDAKAFNQDISSWSVNNVTNYDNMFTGSPMVNETNKHPVFNKP